MADTHDLAAPDDVAAAGLTSNDSLLPAVEGDELPAGAKALPARTVVFSRVLSHPATPSTNTPATPSIAASAVKSTTLVASNVVSAAGTTATGGSVESEHAVDQ